MLVVLNGVKGRQTIDKQIHKELSMAENEGAAVAVDNVAVPTNEWERMLSGELYICGDMQREANMRKRRLVHAINTSAYDAFEERDRLFRELFGSLGKGAFLEPPFNCDYGCNTYIGDNFYANMDCIFLDVARITIGDRVFFGPRVGLYTPYHPIDAAVRASGPEGARPITIGNDVWFGGSADTCRTLAADGKLLTYTPVHAADLTNAAYGDADGYWYGVSVDAVVFAVNSDVLRRMTISAPKDWADLTDPVYQELIWLPTYRSTEIGRLTAYSAALRLGRDKGLDYLAALDTSVQFYTAADDTFVKCLSTGECVIAVGWLHDGLSALSADTSGDLHLIIPASGTFGQVTASAILSGASHTAAAQLWQEFVLSPACADLAEAHGDYRLPTIGSADLVQRTGVTLDPALLSPTGDADTIEDKETLVSDLIETLTDTGIDTEDTARWNVA